MKRVASILALVTVSIILHAQYADHVTYLSSDSLEGRMAGSPGEAAAAEYMYDCLYEAGVMMLTPRTGQDFSIVTEGDTVYSRNVVGIVEGYDEVLKNQYIVIGANLDHIGSNVLTVDGNPVRQIFPGANDNASGIASIIEVARRVASSSFFFRRSIVFVGFGAKEQGMAGSWYFANRAFYGATLAPIPVPHQLQSLASSEKEGKNGLERLVAERRVAFIVSPGDFRTTISEKVNVDEARRVAALLRVVYEQAEGREKGSFHPYRTVGVIVPYRNQIAMIRKEIARLGIPELLAISIDTVERYQGSERDCIIYSFTIQRPYQLDFLTSNTFEEDGATIDRKLNVALTRAREQMFLIGNPELLKMNPVFQKMMEEVKRVGAWVDVEVEKFERGEF